MRKLTAIVALAALASAACATDAPVTVVPVRETAMISGAGSTAQLGAMNAWSAEFRKIHPDLRIDYRAIGSGAGVREFVQGRTAFAGSDVPMKPQEQALADRRCGSRALHLPMVVGPIAVAYNLPSVPRLRLSPATMTGVFTGRITKWDAPEIAAENRGAALPHRDIRVFHRSDDSGTSHNFTAYLKAAGGWPFFPSRRWPAPGEGVAGSAGMTEAVRANEGAIGPMEFGFASNARLQVARVKNAAGEYVELSPESATRALSGAETLDDGSELIIKLDHRTKKRGAYPIVLVTYEIVCGKGSDPLVRGFLSYTASDEGQSFLSLFGYAPLPREVIVKVRALVDAMT